MNQGKKMSDQVVFEIYPVCESMKRNTVGIKLYENKIEKSTVNATRYQNLFLIHCRKLLNSEIS